MLTFGKTKTLKAMRSAFLKLFIVLVVFFASCEKIMTPVIGGYKAILTKVVELFNEQPVQTFTPAGEDFYENGVKYLNGYIKKNITQNPGALLTDMFLDGQMCFAWYPVPTNEKEELWETEDGTVLVHASHAYKPKYCTKASEDEYGNSVWLCYFFVDNTKMENCEWVDNFQGVSIYTDKDGYHYRFTDDGTAVQLSRVKDSNGKYVYWDSLAAYYRYTKSLNYGEEREYF